MNFLKSDRALYLALNAVALLGFVAAIFWTVYAARTGEWAVIGHAGSALCVSIAVLIIAPMWRGKK